VEATVTRDEDEGVGSEQESGGKVEGVEAAQVAAAPQLHRVVIRGRRTLPPLSDRSRAGRDSPSWMTLASSVKHATIPSASAGSAEPARRRWW